MNATRKQIEVAAGGIRDDARGRVLVAKRPEGVHQGGLWEFPGGKLETGETVPEALKRELWEEIGITVHTSTPLITLEHAYPDRTVRLHVREVRHYSGEPRGVEGQPVLWVAPEELDQYSFPAANDPIRTAVQLPDRYPILNLDDHPVEAIGALLEAWRAEGLQLVRFRARQNGPAVERIAASVATAKALGIDVLIDGSVELMLATGAAGLHLPGKSLHALFSRPVAQDHWLAASCHDAQELAEAARLGVDFAVLGPVLPTMTHPGAPSLGWSQFAALVAPAAFPVYALGGVGPEAICLAREHGAQGIAAIRAFLPNAHGLGA